MDEKRRRLSQHDADNCVEIYGLDGVEDHVSCLRKLCETLELDFRDVKRLSVRGRGLLVKLTSVKAVNEWERKSREKRIRLNDIMKDGNEGKVKVFAAAPTKFKLLLHVVRKTLPDFKYIWIGRTGVMARHRSRSQIHVIKNEEDIDRVKRIYVEPTFVQYR